MTGTKTVAERLRNAEGLCATHGLCLVVLYAIGGEAICPLTGSCEECKKGILRALAHQIEAEQAHAVSKEPRGAEPQLPAGIEWPRFPDGELVKFGQHIAQQLENPKDLTRELNGVVRSFTFAVDYLSVSDGKDELCFLYGEPLKRPEPEVLDADGVPIKEGDTVYHEDEGECVVERIYRQNGDTLLDLDVCGASWNTANVKPAEVTHRKPDTQEAINQDAALLVSESFFDQRRDEFEDRVFDLLKRQRKLLGGD